MIALDRWNCGDIFYADIFYADDVEWEGDRFIDVER